VPFFVRSRSTWLLLVGFCAATLAIAGCKGSVPALKFNAIDITGADFGRDFSLNAADGGTRTLADYRGKVVLLFFGFTQCPDVCPTALSRAAQVRKMLGSDGDRLQAIFVTVDPERDLPVVLREYTHAFDPSFVGLYSDVDRTRQTADAFRIQYSKVPTGGSYTMDHTAISYVYDGSGRLRLAVRHTQTAEQLAADIRELLRQP
jgi:protein SCO1/2